MNNSNYENAYERNRELIQNLYSYLPISDECLLMRSDVILLVTHYFDVINFDMLKMLNWSTSNPASIFTLLYRAIRRAGDLKMLCRVETTSFAAKKEGAYYLSSKGYDYVCSLLFSICEGEIDDELKEIYRLNGYKSNYLKAKAINLAHNTYAKYMFLNLFEREGIHYPLMQLEGAISKDGRVNIRIPYEDKVNIETKDYLLRYDSAISYYKDAAEDDDGNVITGDKDKQILFIEQDMNTQRTYEIKIKMSNYANNIKSVFQEGLIFNLAFQSVPEQKETKLTLMKYANTIKHLVPYEELTVDEFLNLAKTEHEEEFSSLLGKAYPFMLRKTRRIIDTYGKGIPLSEALSKKFDEEANKKDAINEERNNIKRFISRRKVVISSMYDSKEMLKAIRDGYSLNVFSNMLIENQIKHFDLTEEFNNAFMECLESMQGVVFRFHPYNEVDNFDYATVINRHTFTAVTPSYATKIRFEDISYSLTGLNKMVELAKSKHFKKMARTIYFALTDDDEAIEYITSASNGPFAYVDGDTTLPRRQQLFTEETGDMIFYLSYKDFPKFKPFVMVNHEGKIVKRYLQD